VARFSLVAALRRKYNACLRLYRNNGVSLARLTINDTGSSSVAWLFCAAAPSLTGEEYAFSMRRYLVTVAAAG